MRKRPVPTIGILIVIAGAMAFGLARLARTKSAPPAANPASQANGPSPMATPNGMSPVPGQKQLLNDIIEKGVTPERAKLLFSMAVGPLPGVTVPPGSRDPADFDGTLAVGYLTEEWDSLTPEQRTVARQLIYGSFNGLGGQRSSSATPRSMVVPVAYVATADPSAFDYQALADTANITLSALLNKPPVNLKVGVNYGPASGTEFAHTTSWTGVSDLYVSSCYMTMWDQMFQPLNHTDAAAVTTHEVFHCYQQREAGDPGKAISVHPWVTEGEATWAMQVVVPGASDAIMASRWIPYAQQPATNFWQRSYDGVGVYAHLADLAGDAAVWPKLLPIYSMAIGGAPHDIPAFNFLTQADQITYFVDWGSSYFEVAQRTPWDMLNRHPPELKGPNPEALTVDNTTAEWLPSVGPYQGKLFTLTGPADIAIVSLITGYGRLADVNFTLDQALDVGGALALCLRHDKCKCPDGSPGASVWTKPATPPVSIGINGGNQTAQLGLVGQSLAAFCKKPDPEPQDQSPPDGGGGPGPGGDLPPSGEPSSGPEGQARGDTHMVTIDGLHYDFQPAGEFTLVKSTTDNFAVQIRMVPVPGSEAVSMSQAIATKLYGHRVTVSTETGKEVVRIDGQEMLSEPPAPLRGALLCDETMYGSSCQLDWPDGTIVRAAQIEGFAMNVAVQPARARLGKLTGLLGDGNGSTANDLVGVGGAQLGTSPTPQDINHSLASAWRVAPGSSLFDHQTGQSHHTVADTTFPKRPIDPARLANRDSAEKTCRQEGITDQYLLADCTLDVAVTNNFAFASAYGHAQRVANARAPGHQVGAGAASPRLFTGGVLRTMYLDGTITDRSVQPTLTFVAKDSDVIWVDPTGCQDANSTITVQPLHHFAGDSVAAWNFAGGWSPGTGEKGMQLHACGMGRVPLMAGTITLVANPNKDELGSFHIPVLFIRHDRVRAIAYGTTVDGVIENAAVHDVYTFDGHAGDVIRIAGDRCDIGRMTTGLKPPGAYVDNAGPMCIGPDATLTTDGTYVLTINSTNDGPARYHFVLQKVSKNR
jgi:hypothetical protein